MKGCLYFNRSVLKLCHALAVDMRERYGIKDWSAYISGEPSYKLVTEDKDINYTHFVVEDFLNANSSKEKVDEKFLASKEKEYGNPFLWPTFISDRIMIHNWPEKFYIGYNPKFSHEEIRQQLQIRIKETEKFLDEAKPNFVLMNAVSSMGAMLLHAIANKKGIKTIIFEPNRINDRVGFTESIYGVYTGVEKKFRDIKAGLYKSPHREEGKRWVENFRNKPIRPSYVERPFEQTTIQNAVLFLKNLVRKLLDSFKTDFPRVYNYSISGYLKRNYLMWVNTHIRIPKFGKPDFNEDYVFYPLHYDPELSTMVYAPYYVDQLWLIKSIAQSLPINFKLYVKEHPTMIGLRGLDYYNEIKKIPNVKLLDPSVNSLEIVKNAKIITVISSTAGWEGVLLKKPVITFGSVFYNEISMVRRCKVPEELPLMVKDCLINYSYNNDEIIDFVSLMIEESVDINLDKLWYRERDINRILKNPDLKKLSDAIMHVVG